MTKSPDVLTSRKNNSHMPVFGKNNDNSVVIKFGIDRKKSAKSWKNWKNCSSSKKRLNKRKDCQKLGIHRNLTLKRAAQTF